MTDDNRETRLRVAGTLDRIHRLRRSRQERDQRGLFFIEGVRNFVSAIDNGLELETIVYSERLLTSCLARKLVRRLRRASVRTVKVTPEEYRALSRAERASGVAAIVRQRLQRLENVQPRAGTCRVVLSQLRSPGNFGCLIRTSAAVGGAGFILIGGSLDPFDPDVIRATMGALFGQTFVRTSAGELRQWIERHDLQAVGASPDGAVDYDRIRYRPPPLIVLGDERKGLDAEQRRLCHDLVRIPMVEGFDSLNLSVAGGLLMYEALRSRR